MYYILCEKCEKKQTKYENYIMKETKQAMPEVRNK